MTTTVIFVEIMIMGVITLAWLFLLSIRIGIVGLDHLTVVLPILKEWSTPILVVAAALAYQLGSLMNTASYGVMEFLVGGRMKNSIMSPYDYYKVAAVGYQRGSPDILRSIGAHLTYIRLARSAIFNFFFLSIALFTWRFWGMAVLSLLLAIASYPIWRKIYKLRLIDLRAAYEAIINLQDADSQASNTVAPTT